MEWLAEHQFDRLEQIYASTNYTKPVQQKVRYCRRSLFTLVPRLFNDGGYALRG